MKTTPVFWFHYTPDALVVLESSRIKIGVGDMDAFMKEKTKLYTESAKRLGLGK